MSASGWSRFLAKTLGLHTASSIPLLVNILSLITARTFPVNKLREFLRKPLFSLLNSRPLALNSAKSAIFPCIFPVNRDFRAKTG